jgi:uncharacterized damage-inducible protein DinB
MNYYGAKELAESFRTVRKNTIQIAQDIPEDKYGFRAAPETRTVAQLLTHIALSFAFQHQIHAKERRTTLEGFDFPALMQRFTAEEQKQRSKQEIVEMLRNNGEEWAAWLGGLPDDFLGERVAMPAGMGQPAKSRFEMILGVKEHEMHHRAQLMLIERLLGITPHLTKQMQERMASMAAPAKA